MEVRGFGRELNASVFTSYSAVLCGAVSQDLLQRLFVFVIL